MIGTVIDTLLIAQCSMIAICSMQCIAVFRKYGNAKDTEHKNGRT